MRTKKTSSIFMVIVLEKDVRAKLNKSNPYRQSLKAGFYPWVSVKGFIRGTAVAVFVPFHRVQNDTGSERTSDGFSRVQGRQQHAG